MLYIIDGTGPWLDSVYDSEMSGSFCRQLARVVNRSHYNRGPSLLGVELGRIVGDICLQIRKQPGDEPIYLCGYSRGGAAAVIVAREIKPRPVKAMFLFDAVDRALSVSGEKISGNVRNVYHAMRDRNFARQHEGAVVATRAALDRANTALSATNAGSRIRAAFQGETPRLLLRSVNA